MRHPIILGLSAVSMVLVGFVARPAMVQAPTRAPVAAVGTDPASQIAALSQRVATLEAAVTALKLKTDLVKSDGRNYSIEAPGELRLMSRGNTDLAVGQNANITVGQNATFKAQQSIAMTGGTNVSLKGTLVSVNASANLGLTGAMVTLNRGGSPAARVGSVVNMSGGAGQVATGSATVLIGN